jgi:sterol desaturase/sphingolipid hydroxylase (fatty acid hydroxylase superfamily)
VIHFFWDRILGTYRRPDAGQTLPVTTAFISRSPPNTAR